MSGRRSSSSGGKRRRHRGNLHVQRQRRNGEIGRGLADQHGDRVLQLRPGHRGLERLGPRRVELRFGLDDVAAGGHADGVLVARELQRALVARDAVLQQANLRILHAQQEVILCELRLQRQPCRRQLVGRGFGCGRARFDGASDAAPEIELPGRHDADVLIGSARGQRWVVPRSRRLGQRQRLPHARFGGADRLVVHVGRRRQRIEVGVAEELPPVSGCHRAPRRGHRRRAGFLVRRRHIDGRTQVLGPDRARDARREGGRDGEEAKDAFAGGVGHRPNSAAPLAPVAARSPPRRRPRTQRLKRSR